MTTPQREYDSNSWRDEYDDQGRKVAVTWANNPEHPNSWRIECNDRGHGVAVTWANDPKHPRSWRRE